MEFPSDKKIILFDGICNLCNSSVQSDLGESFVKERGIDTSKTDSIILLEPEVAYYTKSAAVLKIGQEFGGGWKLLALLEWIPPVIRDFFYDIIARNRYRWFGKQESCMIPTPELKARFLDV